ncbi:heat stress transcription factor A-5 [Ricinus communis]|uniref:heat stress transcription factor A-5 n=1 Tax=Ricinus communis TaxID=3988 RepID=UPI00201A3D9B|nr:heat stress transcription factor A-5 [Ricinus communis]XP_025013787.2 heat stress transcription factor A-5 [Ricinus communis]XP_048235161.1 heat stress transcription factor A-5 [Ricinus communis]
MEATTSAAAAAGGGGGGPAPFLLKTYDMVDDTATDDIVSWSSAKNSFVVWNPPEFARLLLPTYFKHNNFSSFIRQLNTYGFRKIDPEKWEFANEDFVKDQKHLLKNIHRRKPIHSHSNPPGSAVDPERAAFDEEIDRLTHEKATLEANIVRYKKQQSAEKLQLEDLMQKVDSMGQRQEKLLAFLEKAVQNPTFVENLAQKIESMGFSAYSKKRRLPQVDHSKSIAENSFVGNHSITRSEFGNVIHQDFSNKLRLELSPAVSDINLVSDSTQSSNEDGGSPQRKISGGDPKDAHPRTPCLLFAAEATFELSDTGTSYTYKMDPNFPRRVTANETPELHLLQQNLSSNEEVDGHISCHLNLTLASSPLQINRTPYSARMPELGQEICTSSESKFNENGKESDARVTLKERYAGEGKTILSSSKEAPNNNQGPAAAPPRVNDIFWEQFLTERPGSSDNEEASSNYRANPYEEQEDRRSGHGVLRHTKIVEHLSL